MHCACSCAVLAGKEPSLPPPMQVWYFTSTAVFPSAWGHSGGLSMCMHMERCPVLAASRKTYEDHARVQLPKV